MSYAYQLGERALAGLRRMETWLAEETLDELDRLCEDPPACGRRVGDAVVCDFVRDRGPQRFYVFISVFPDCRDPHSSRERHRFLRLAQIGNDPNATGGDFTDLSIPGGWRLRRGALPAQLAARIGRPFSVVPFDHRSAV